MPLLLQAYRPLQHITPVSTLLYIYNTWQVNLLMHKVAKMSTTSP